MKNDDPAWSLIDAIYDAAVNGSLWRNALDRLREVTDSQQACLFVLDNNAPSKITAFEYQDFNPDAIKEYLGEMAAHDPNVQHA